MFTPFVLSVCLQVATIRNNDKLKIDRYSTTSINIQTKLNCNALIIVIVNNMQLIVVLDPYLDR